MLRRCIWPALWVAALLCACKDDKGNDNPPPPPPAASSQAGACSSGGGQVNDPLSEAFFPRAVDAPASYCLDPQSGARTYGEKGKLSMDDVCTTALDGECEVYKSFGMTRLVALRYVDGGGGGGTVEVYLSQYKDAAGGYAMFTKRVVGDGDPADPTEPRPLAAGAAAAIGTGRAYVWKGAYLAELQYNNDQEAPDQLAKSSEAILTSLGRAIGSRLPGSVDKPDPAQLLPTAGLIPNGILFVPKDALGFAGLGPTAIGFYKEGDKRFRLISFTTTSEGAAKDAMKAVRAHAGSLPVGGVGDEAIRALTAAMSDAPKAELLVARKGALVLGASDEPFAIKAGDAPDKQAAARLSKDDAIAKLKAWFSSAALPAPKK
jgi:hypothetical protein